MTIKTCPACGAEFEAKRPATKFCSDRCRQRAHRNPAAAKVVDLPAVSSLAAQPAARRAGVLAAATGELENAGRLETSRGQLALLAAERLENSSRDTASSVAALMRAFGEAMAAALDGAEAEDDPIAAARKRVLQLVSGG